MTDQFVAEIRLFAGNFAPTGWAFCNGQLLPISQNTALFSLLGTTYGGDGRSTFGLPDLQDRVPIHTGGGQPGPGLSVRDLGEQGGAPSVTLLASEMPAHGHAAAAAAGSTDIATGHVPAAGGRYVVGTGPSSNLPHNNRSPYLGLSFIIALQGIFPPRA
jgi:microcystin-dependent protein